MDRLKFEDLEFFWLQGGTIHLDGGAIFGVVPKPLWQKYYPANERNQVKQKTDPIYFELNGNKIIIDSGIGNGKLTEKQKRNFGCTAESNVVASLNKLGVKPSEINYILLTHMHFDHACGLTEFRKGKFCSVFPNASIIVSKKEWDETRNPTIRSANTYWQNNWKAVAEQVHTFETEIEITNGLAMINTGGHSKGHSIIIFERRGKKAIHMGDLMITFAHRPSLWVSAYDDYPMDSIYIKEKWVKKMMAENAWFLFYHDAFYRAVKWNKSGEVVEKVKAT